MIAARGASLTLAAFMLTGALFAAAPFVLAQSSHVWSGAADFQSGTFLDTALSSSGGLVLATHPGNWTAFAGNPVLSPSQGWDSARTLEPDVMYEAGIYKMWYVGCAATCQIGYATSADGVTWTPYAGNPVLAANASSWDNSVGLPRVIHDGSLYRMWYGGNGPSGIRVGYASSADGIHWAKYGTAPVFGGAATWDQGSVNTAAVVKVGNGFVMYFSGQSTTDPSLRVGRATSVDGLNWVEYAGNPVMSPQAAWEGNRIYVSWLSYGVSGYDLYYYAGSNGNTVYIGHATSGDGTNWTKDPANPVLGVGSSGSWDGSTVAHPSLVTVGNELRMYFTGYNQSYYQIGFATASSTGEYDPGGSWISNVYDSGDANTAWTLLSWIGDVPSSTAIAAAVIVGNTSVRDTSWTLSTPSATSPVQLHVPKARYASVVIALISTNSSRSPTVATITLAYELPSTSGSGNGYWGLGLVGFWLLIALVAGVVVALVVVLLWQRGPQRTALSRGEGQPTPCPRCGSPVPAGNRFCGACGSEVPPRSGGPPPIG